MIDISLTLFNWRDHVQHNVVEPWVPHALMHEQWPPNYLGVYAFRHKMIDELCNDPIALASAKAYYSTRPAEFIQHWMDTYDPRKKSNRWMPFVFFKRQYEFIEFLHESAELGENALIEKCRDVGLTWLACAYSVWRWLFVSNDAIGWGSRKQELVDKLGDLDSIFEKMRKLIDRLPFFWLPRSFDYRKHATFMKLVNPDNGSVISGEAGDNIGRGGRKAMFFKDESAHYERAELIEAALGDNTNVQVDISSVNGTGNVFHRRRKEGLDWAPGRKLEPGYTRVFVFDWRDHPGKTQEWYDQRKAKYVREGMAHIFAQEVDRDYSGAVTNRVIPREWLDACIDAHLVIPYLMRRPEDIPRTWRAGLDVADEGLDRNALATGQWIIWRTAEEWGERDPGLTARRAIEGVRGLGHIRVQYDGIGVGAGVKTEYNRLTTERDHNGQLFLDPNVIAFVPWNAGAKVQNPYARIVSDDEESLTNEAMFGNLKAQAWWSMRTRVYKTWHAVKHGAVYRDDELISFDSKMPLLYKVLEELSQATKKSNGALKMIIEKTPDGTVSPNIADAGVMMFFPIEENSGPLIGSYGGALAA